MACYRISFARETHETHEMSNIFFASFRTTIQKVKPTCTTLYYYLRKLSQPAQIFQRRGAENAEIRRVGPSSRRSAFSAPLR